MPDFVELSNQYSAQGLQFIGIDLDPENKAKALKIIEKLQIPYPILLADTKIGDTYGGMNAIPVTFLIDRKGMMRAHYIGMRQKSDLESIALALLREK